MNIKSIGTILIFFALFVAFSSAQAKPADTLRVTADMVAHAESLIGLQFTPTEIDSMLEYLDDNLEFYDSLRTIVIGNDIPPALNFNPVPTGMKFDSEQRPIILSPPEKTRRPRRLKDMAWYSVRDLGELVRTRQISSMELTRLSIDRLKKYGPMLHCVITLTEDLAYRQAQKADSEIAAGNYRGPLHGIPYGAKDLLAVRGYPTTWGTGPYKDQVIDMDATVIQKLEDAGAVLVAKLSMGELAWGDVWFEDTTRNPWNIKKGSSGSSAGSASAVSAGLVPFAIGTETWGSIVSPSTVCGVTGLRPTYGRVSRHGAMALSWSMDKIGPICRTVEDCAVVFDVIHGADGWDRTTVDMPFNYSPDIDLKKLRVGYLKKDFDSDTTFKKQDEAALKKLRQLGADLVEIELPRLPTNSLQIILLAESAAAFDEMTRLGRDDLMTRQVKDAWPNVFRVSRFIPAVEYIQANRVRTVLIQEMARLFEKIDLYVAPSFEGDNLLLNNLTGHPCVVLPTGMTREREWASITFIGRLYDEGTVLAFAKKYQDATKFHKEHPPLFK
ncbi:MAG: amidase [candidate division Zixibacteria bacterium RBG_16_53_22]|nr:MAG: amidase [candidate division Zixibacteria bacterium RBG_16_53_22]